MLAFLICGENKYLNGSFYVGLILIVVAVTFQMARVYVNRKQVVMPVNDETV